MEIYQPRLSEASNYTEKLEIQILHEISQSLSADNESIQIRVKNKET